MEQFQEDLTQSKILPKILVPKKLLTANNFKYHMKNVSTILDYAKENERAQTSQNPNNNILQLNDMQQTPQNQNANFNATNQQIRGSQTGNKPNTAKSNISSEDISKSYKSLLFTARNFGITSSHYFHTENSSLHAAQRYGSHKKQKLKPLRQTKSGKFFEQNLSYKPIRVVETPQPSNLFYKKIITVKGMSLVVTLKSFEIELKGEGEDQKSQREKVKEKLTFQDAYYLSLHSFEYINTFFQKYVDYSEPRNQILIDWDGFAKIPFIKQTDNNDQLYPTQIYKDIERSQKVLEITFPQLNFYLNEAAHQQIYTCSQQELQDLIKNNFSTLQNLVEQRFKFDEAREIHEQVLLKQGISQSFSRQDLNAENSDQIKEEKQEDEEEDFEKQFNPEDKDLVNSVTKIQASFKGKKAREEVKNIKQQKEQQQETNQKDNNNIQEEDEEENFDKQFNPDDKDLVNSVTKIQASFKGKKARDEVKQIQQQKQQKKEMEEQFNPEDKDLVNSVTKIQASFKGKKDREEVKKMKKVKQEEEFKEQFKEDDQDLVNSVTKIQASFKGKKARGEVEQIKKQQEKENEIKQMQEQFNPEDQDLVNSVTKIQASFKGKKDRDEVKKLKKEKQEEEFKQQFKEDDQDLVNSVTKIQASFKGKQARQQVKNLKNNQENKNEIQEEEENENQQEQEQQKQETGNEEEDFTKQYDPNDEQMVQKVTKIQARIKGNQTRSKMNNNNNENQEENQQQQQNNEDKKQNQKENNNQNNENEEENKQQQEKLDNKLEI